MGKILGRRPNHGWATDVDLLDRLGLRGTRLNRFPEWIEVDDHQRDRLDPRSQKVGSIFGQIRARQNTAVNSGMKGLDAPAKHLRALSMVRDLAGRHSRLAKVLEGPAGRKDRESEPYQAFGKGDDSLLVGDAQQGQH